MKAIVECDFHIEACHNRSHSLEKLGAYKINVNFYSDSEKKDLISKRKLTIMKESPTTVISGQPVYDIYSYNGISSSKASVLFGNKNFPQTTLTECKATVDFFNQSKDAKGQVLFVLDLKNFPQHADDKSYSNRKSIEESEKKLLAFLKVGCSKSSSQAEDFRLLLLSTPLSYVILEGSLKAAFIAEDFLSDAEKLFFQTRGVGCQSFCQIIEFFLNAFKRGEQVVLKNHLPTGEIEKKYYNRAQYIQKLQDTAPDYEPTNISHTIYPATYYEIATQGIYTKSMCKSTLFSTKTAIHDNQIVEMTTIKNEEPGL